MSIIFPLEADRYLVANEFAKRILANKATDAELAYMTKYLDLPFDDSWFDSPESLCDAQLSVYGFCKVPEEYGMGAFYQRNG